MKKWIIVILIAVIAGGLIYGGLYLQREKSCRRWATALLDLDSKHPIEGTEGVSGYNNVGKYKELYENCMFLQGY